MRVVGDLPDPLVMANGDPVTTPAMWNQERRPELLELFRTKVYGRPPALPPEALHFEVTGVTTGMMDGRADRTEVSISYQGPGGTGTMDLLMFVPCGLAAPVPAFLLISHRGLGVTDPDRVQRTEYWPAEEIVSRGYAAVTFDVTQLSLDEYDGFHNGAHQVLDTERSADSWGTIGAWAWGASRAMDYLSTDSRIDPERVAVLGHSRGGKTALWAGAQDERFALVISNDSGCTGAAIARGNKGETVGAINKGFPHWFCDNYKSYGGRESDLPVDQHELLALVAPRLVYVASASQDSWADPEAEFLSCVKAGPVFELLGKSGVGADDMPDPDSPLQTGHIGYHLRTGGHDLTRYDWARFLDFADRHMRRGQA